MNPSGPWICSEHKLMFSSEHGMQMHIINEHMIARKLVCSQDPPAAGKEEAAGRQADMSTAEKARYTGLSVKEIEEMGSGGEF